MVACAIIGDSIAVGMAMEFRHCYRNARDGLPSGSIIRRAPPFATQWTVISAGSNDPHNPGLRSNLWAIRSRVRASQVIWILPHHPAARAAVMEVASSRGDRVVGFAASRDHVHPRSYGAVAAATMAVTGRSESWSMRAMASGPGFAESGPRGAPPPWWSPWPCRFCMPTAYDEPRPYFASWRSPRMRMRPRWWDWRWGPRPPFDFPW
ncbi:MAG: hypothetical protein JO273_24805 [Methylobacteriaceae bacterium]|nr:hypothetical protein [Methylobacteriaceae bacterium]